MGFLLILILILNITVNKKIKEKYIDYDSVIEET